MSQSTREWLLAKYVKAAQSCAEMGKTLSKVKEELLDLKAKYEQQKVLLYQTQSELARYKGTDEVAARLEKMSVGAHVTVNVSNLGHNYKVKIDSVHTSGGHTTINGHL